MFVNSTRNKKSKARVDAENTACTEANGIYDPATGGCTAKPLTAEEERAEQKDCEASGWIYNNGNCTPRVDPTTFYNVATGQATSAEIALVTSYCQATSATQNPDCGQQSIQTLSTNTLITMYNDPDIISKMKQQEVVLEQYVNTANANKALQKFAESNGTYVYTPEEAEAVKQLCFQENGGPVQACTDLKQFSFDYLDSQAVIQFDQNIEEYNAQNPNAPLTISYKPNLAPLGSFENPISNVLGPEFSATIPDPPPSLWESYWNELIYGNPNLEITGLGTYGLGGGNAVLIPPPASALDPNNPQGFQNWISAQVYGMGSGAVVGALVLGGELLPFALPALETQALVILSNPVIATGLQLVQAATAGYLTYGAIDCAIGPGFICQNASIMAFVGYNADPYGFTQSFNQGLRTIYNTGKILFQGPSLEFGLGYMSGGKPVSNVGTVASGETYYGPQLITIEQDGTTSFSFWNPITRSYQPYEYVPLNEIIPDSAIVQAVQSLDDPISSALAPLVEIPNPNLAAVISGTALMMGPDITNGIITNSPSLESQLISTPSFPLSPLVIDFTQVQNSITDLIGLPHTISLSKSPITDNGWSLYSVGGPNANFIIPDFPEGQNGVVIQVSSDPIPITRLQIADPTNPNGFRVIDLIPGENIVVGNTTLNFNLNSQNVPILTVNTSQVFWNSITHLPTPFEIWNGVKSQIKLNNTQNILAKSLTEPFSDEFKVARYVFRRTDLTSLVTDPTTGEILDSYEILLSKVENLMTNEGYTPLEAVNIILAEGKESLEVDLDEIAIIFIDQDSLSAKVLCNSKIDCLETPMLQKALLTDLGVKSEVILGIGGTKGNPDFPFAHGALLVDNEVIGYNLIPRPVNVFQRFADAVKWGNFTTSISKAVQQTTLPQLSLTTSSPAVAGANLGVRTAFELMIYSAEYQITNLVYLVRDLLRISITATPTDIWNGIKNSNFVTKYIVDQRGRLPWLRTQNMTKQILSQAQANIKKDYTNIMQAFSSHSMSRAKSASTIPSTDLGRQVLKIMKGITPDSRFPSFNEAVTNLDYARSSLADKILLVNSLNEAKIILSQNGVSLYNATRGFLPSGITAQTLSSNEIVIDPNTLADWTIFKPTLIHEVVHIGLNRVADSITSQLTTGGNKVGIIQLQGALFAVEQEDWGYVYQARTAIHELTTNSTLTEQQKNELQGAVDEAMVFYNWVVFGDVIPISNSLSLSIWANDLLDALFPPQAPVGAKVDLTLFKIAGTTINSDTLANISKAIQKYIPDGWTGMTPTQLFLIGAAPGILLIIFAVAIVLGIILSPFFIQKDIPVPQSIINPPAIETQIVQTQIAQTQTAQNNPNQPKTISDFAMGIMSNCVQGDWGYFNACVGQFFHGIILATTDGIIPIFGGISDSPTEHYWCTDLVWDSAIAAGYSFSYEIAGALNMYDDFIANDSVVLSENANYDPVSGNVESGMVAFVSKPHLDGSYSVAHVGIVSEIITTDTGTYELDNQGRLVMYNADGTPYYIRGFGDIETYAQNQ
ncbi:hypothetical protein A2130_04915 [Candidatus Woesebacteria bacterium GWC2_33_12]|uniref:Uncharacterized protein n=1 Tax=Candidatus Woesebacteria bacterium GW2011_GWB1_33_22 TaxID=1618566 RepID=A0A0F9ZKH0_9BACT|nr:MAG: hypothetical protein UR29_C0011G0015 [Candidatus Woesebacteria bacterium GW2011_GWC2_33_12]KKP41949.1 MAG: hypothetical protein UR33_C0007G0012 [Candidatus Woesebacteria bacterium GW2011_GWA2_33_20]KKP44614.1 MAG: hypothetical protein UR35_C0007G0030 [Candidatus Woesebacteria bacterium GW2011_GWB1_33_22]KKP46418.1 MAG: hypothetical protein UR37_C0008G0030 [Microgenomates group bacterium GW2011_GWC1_33_28]KKP50472.1 MAG: hypothetical protein UR41_C0007G0030 [Candidatus Woesebacteria bact